MSPDIRKQRCWFHVQGNVLAALPRSARPGAKAALAEIYQAEDNDHPLAAAKAFEAGYGTKWPKATVTEAWWRVGQGRVCDQSPGVAR